MPSPVVNRRVVMGGAPAVAFSPSSVTGLQVWLQADSLALADADPVATWTDSSGNGNNATQATSGSQPTYKTNIVNGKPVVRFDGTDDWLASVTMGGQRQIFAVFRNATALFNGYWGLLEARSATVSDRWGLFTISSDNFYNDPSPAEAWRNGVSVSPISASLAPIDEFFVLVYTTPNAGSAARGIGQLQEVVFGAFDLAELLLYDAPLSDSNRQAVQSYLGTKYGVTITP